MKYQNVWVHFCRMYCYGTWGKTYDLFDIEDSMPRWLEEHGYIVTCEMGDDIAVKPIGYYFLGDNRVGFCTNMRQHKPLFGAE